MRLRLANGLVSHLEGLADPFLSEQLKPGLLKALCDEKGLALTLRNQQATVTGERPLSARWFGVDLLFVEEGIELCQWVFPLQVLSLLACYCTVRASKPLLGQFVSKTPEYNSRYKLLFAWVQDYDHSYYFISSLVLSVLQDT